MYVVKHLRSQRLVRRIAKRPWLKAQNSRICSSSNTYPTGHKWPETGSGPYATLNEKGSSHRQRQKQGSTRILQLGILFWILSCPFWLSATRFWHDVGLTRVRPLEYPGANRPFWKSSGAGGLGPRSSFISPGIDALLSYPSHHFLGSLAVTALVPIRWLPLSFATPLTLSRIETTIDFCLIILLIVCSPILARTFVRRAVCTFWIQLLHSTRSSTNETSTSKSVSF